MAIVEYTRIVIERSPDAFLVKCGRCSGTGENNREYECHVCKGTGKVLLQVPPEWSGENLGILKCGRCGGTGENNREYFCRVCKGVGSLVKCFPRVECSRCDGSGENNREYFCSSCDACGSVYLRKVPTY
jgi:DnaJ-class molecular chaperone